LSNDSEKVSEHLANERTYLAWLRTGIAIVGLGFIIAKFGLALRDLLPTIASTSIHLSGLIGLVLVIAGSLIELMAAKRFVKNQERIRLGKYEATSGIAVVISIALFATTMLLVAYFLMTL